MFSKRSLKARVARPFSPRPFGRGFFMREAYLFLVLQRRLHRLEERLAGRHLKVVDVEDVHGMVAQCHVLHLSLLEAEWLGAGGYSPGSTMAEIRPLSGTQRP